MTTEAERIAAEQAKAAADYAAAEALRQAQSNRDDANLRGGQ
ncbi:hypothetical protein [Streptomyces sp. NPDC058045]